MNVLLSSIGRRAYLVRYFQQALGRDGSVIATNCISETTGMFAADIAEVVPSGKDPGFINALLDVCERYKVKLLCSLHDWESPFIAAHKQRFRDIGVIPIIADSDVVDICLDKYKTWQFAKKHGILILKTFIDLDAVKHDLKSGEISFPLILKPRLGHSSIGIKKVYDEEQLAYAYRCVIHELGMQEFSSLTGENTGDFVIIQQFSEGREYGVDIVNDLNGNFVACFVKYKFAMRSGETDVAETLQFFQIETVARKIAAVTRHPGNMDADFFVSDNNEILLLELNPRFGGGYPFSHEAGANVPAALIAWAKGEEPDPNWLKIKYGVRCFKDIAMVNRYHRL